MSNNQIEYDIEIPLYCDITETEGYMIVTVFFSIDSDPEEDLSLYIHSMEIKPFVFKDKEYGNDKIDIFNNGIFSYINLENIDSANDITCFPQLKEQKIENQEDFELLIEHILNLKAKKGYIFYT